MIKRVFGIMLCICMMVTLLPATAWAIDYHDLNVAGTNVVGENNITYWLCNTDGTITSTGASEDNYNVKFDPTATPTTLTLNNAAIVCDTKEPIYSEDDLTIKLVGTNTVTTTSMGSAIYVYRKDFTFEGGGTLNATGSGRCIPADGGNIVVISGATVNATGTGNNSFGIYSSFNGGSGGNITISSATVTAKGETYGICASNSINISDSTVTATAATTRNGVSAHGISSDSSSISITGSTVTVTAECINHGSFGISCSFFNDAKITITDSTVTVKTVAAEGYSNKAKALSDAPEFGATLLTGTNGRLTRTVR